MASSHATPAVRYALLIIQSKGAPMAKKKNKKKGNKKKGNKK